MLERMVTVSRATPGLSLEAVFAIIRTAHARNSLAGLTGALLYLDGSFIHVLEGLPVPLAEARTRIAGDSRHGFIQLRARERVLCRLFPDQPLALRTRVDPQVLGRHGYVPGVPASLFPTDELLELVLAAFRGGHRTATVSAAVPAAGLRPVRSEGYRAFS